MGKKREFEATGANAVPFQKKRKNSDVVKLPDPGCLNQFEAEAYREILLLVTIMPHTTLLCPRATNTNIPGTVTPVRARPKPWNR